MSYSVCGIGGQVHHYTAREDSWVWTVPLVRNSGVIDSVQCFGVLSILTVSVGRQSLVEGSMLFPHVPKEVFNEITNKEVQVLVGNPDLSLQPQCPKGFGNCTDCAKTLLLQVMV